MNLPDTLPTKSVFIVVIVLFVSFIVVLTTMGSSKCNPRVEPIIDSTSLRLAEQEFPVGEEEDSPTSVATSGKLWHGEQKFTFDRSKLQFNGYIPLKVDSHDSPSKGKDSLICEHWAVVTTIFEPSDAVIKQAKLKGWCLCVVGDKKTPAEYDVKSNLSNFVFLTSEMQEEMADEFPISQALPWNHFGRKNFGFIYVMYHGAKVIWDFDDDNLLLAKEHAYLLPRAFEESHHLTNKYSGHSYEGFEPTRTSDLLATATEDSAARRALTEARSIWPTTCGLVVNPYPLMGASHDPCWPRGFPLECIQFSAVEYSVENGKKTQSFPSETIGILQSLANHDPDVDAIYRLTEPLPLDFPITLNTHHKQPNSNIPMILPKGMYAPYNAQATMHLDNALWSLLLPVTVAGRVSDIWRGYAAIRLGQDIGMRMAFTPPLVVQFRNAHSYLADFDSEIPLYERSLRLVEQLDEWQPSLNCAVSLPARMEELWVFLYEHGYIEMGDVVLMQHWIESLVKVGYEFPPILLKK